MQQDYTINDAFKEGFESGLVYILRYNAETNGVTLTDRDIVVLGEHLWNHKPWRDSAAWAEFIHKNVRKHAR